VAPDGTVVVFGLVSGSLPGQTPTGSFNDVFVRTYDADGNELWTRQFGTLKGQFYIHGAVGPNGTIYVTGGTFGEFTAQPNLNRDVFVRAYDLSGSELWTRQFGGIEPGSDDNPSGAAADASGLYISGYVSGTLPGQTHASENSDGFLVHFDPDGSMSMARQFGGGISVITTGLAIEPLTHDVFVLESRSDHTDPNIRGSLFVMRLHPDGSTVFERQFSNLLQDESYSDAATDSEGNLYIVGIGRHQTSLDKDPEQILVRRLSPEAEPVWRMELGGSGIDEGYAVSTDAAGNVFAGGIADASGVAYGYRRGDGYLAKIVQGHSCLGTPYPSGDEDGVLSRPVHESIEPAADVTGLRLTVHAINCDTFVRVGL
jgi:hypothetical protein